MEKEVSYKGTGSYSEKTNLTQTLSVSDSSMSIDVTVDLTPSRTTNAISFDPDDHHAEYGFEEELEEVLDEEFDFNRLADNVRAESRGVTPDTEDEEAVDGAGYLGKGTETYNTDDYIALGDDYFTKAQEVVEDEEVAEETTTATYQAPEETEDVESPAAVKDETEYDGLETEVETPVPEDYDYDPEVDSPEETPSVTLEALLRTGIILH
jgi:hypothetical protein